MMVRMDTQQIARRQGVRLFVLFVVGFFGGAAAEAAAGTSWAFLAVNVVVFTLGGRWACQPRF